MEKLSPETYRYIRYQLFRKKKNQEVIKDALSAQGMDKESANKAVSLVFKTEVETLRKRAVVNIILGIFLTSTAIILFFLLMINMTEEERTIGKSIFIGLALVMVLGTSIMIKGYRFSKFKKSR
ncbi:MAG: hypothetical protein MK066_04715 [Crocinitomicaceae bacterium]|nr:hypothetical protein [Crocinitomicaceae bacterium]